MEEYPLVIDEKPTGVRGRARAALRGRRIAITVVLALVEVVAFLIWRPSVVLVTLFAGLVLALAVLLAVRLKAGLGRDLVMIVAGAQALVVGIPLAIGFSIVTGLIVGVLLIVGLIVVAFTVKA
ncbi:MAG: hypothetical protein MUE51_14245 [Thermoleophilia bacterium]|jgi:hypothetical protein|nr:hypothetical protein [Thermoleophilia bacterium]